MLHWLAVGYVSPAAREAIVERGGRVDEVKHDPAFLLVGLEHNPEGYWSWSHGRREHRGAVEFWNTGEIQMEHLTLQYGPRNAEYCSVEETYLLMPDEDFDQEAHRVVERPALLTAQASGDSDPFLPDA
ncbi:MAG: hypothetical protein JOZ57_10190 [Abitibacteriaceae bacterium]|nr:hypothetical protein [Abditibacteriaceae bacterium]